MAGMKHRKLEREREREREREVSVVFWKKRQTMTRKRRNEMKGPDAKK